MALRHPIEPEHEHTTAVAPTVASEVASVREPFGVAQVVCIAMGIFFVAVGAIGLARSGLDSLTGSTTEVARLEMTPLLSLMHLVVGVIALGGGTSRSAARGVSMVVGPLLIAAGIVALVEPIEQLGWNETNGLAYLVAGGAAILAAILTPVRLMEDRRVTTA